MEELACVTAAQKGDVNAFNQLVLNYQDVAYNVAYRILGEQDEAADATQEAFVKAFRALHSFHGGSFKAWLLRIVTNTCYDVLRSRRRQPFSSLDEMLEHPEHPLQLVHRHEGPDDHALRAELNSLIQAGIAALPQEQRVVLVLCDIEGFSYAEVAEITGAEMGTVKSRLSRGRARLRDLLRECIAGCPPQAQNNANATPWKSTRSRSACPPLQPAPQVACVN